MSSGASLKVRHSPMMLAELLRGFAEDMKPEEGGLRREQGMKVMH